MNESIIHDEIKLDETQEAYMSYVLHRVAETANRAPEIIRDIVAQSELAIYSEGVKEVDSKLAIVIDSFSEITYLELLSLLLHYKI